MSEDIKLHDTETRINPSGHKELVKKKKGKPDEETLNELARELEEQIGTNCPGCSRNCQCNGYCQSCIDGETGPLAEALAGYDSLPGQDEFEDGGPRCVSCDRNSIDLLFAGGPSTDVRQYDGGTDYLCFNCAKARRIRRESIDFAGPLPTGGGAGMPQQPEYDRRHNVFSAPEAPTQTGAMERASHDSLSNMTGATPVAADGPEEQKAKTNLPANPRGNPRRRKNNDEYTGDGIDYGATHSESFTGTGAIAIAPNISFQKRPEDDEDEDTDTNDTSESLMTQKRTLNEWEPPFEAGDYEPGDYQMPSPKGDGVAKRKAKQDKVGAYDTDTSQDGKEWPRDHNETGAMGRVNDSGIDDKPAGTHETSVADPKDGHQDNVGHDWPDEAKNTGGGVAEPFEGDRWSDGGTLKGSSQDDFGTAKKNQSKAAGPGTITGTSGPQYGEPQEGWSPEGIGALMEGGDIDVRNLFDNYARQQIRTSNIICLEDFQELCRAHGCDAAINEHSLMHFMDANDEFVFFEGNDASGRYWAGQPLTESDCCAECGCDPCECAEDCVEEGAARRPFDRMLSELQIRSPEAEAGYHQRTLPGDPDYGVDQHARFKPMDDDDPLAPDDYDEAMAGYQELEARKGPGPMSNMLDAPDVDDPDSMEFGAGDEFDELDVASRPMTNFDPDEIDDFGPYGNEDDIDIDSYGQGVGPGRRSPGGMGHRLGPNPVTSWRPDPMESKVTTYTPESVDALKAFIESAKSITSIDGDPRAIGQALTESWKYYAGKIDARTTPPQVQKTLKQLMAKYKTFSPLAECSDMGEGQGKAISGGGRPPVSPDLAAEDNPGPEKIEDKGEPFGGSQKNTIGTPIVKGTGKGMAGKNYSESLRRNVAKLAEHVKKPLAEATRGIEGKYGMSFTALVIEGKRRNRTTRRSILAEALADVEELILLHGADNVVLETYITRGREITRKFDISMIPLKARGPLISEGKAVFRFNRTAQKFAETLVMEGITCRVEDHNWGNSVSAKANPQQAKNAFQMICG